MEKMSCPKNERNCEFSRIIEKRIRKYTRLNKLFRKGDKILVKDNVSEYFVKRIIKDLPVKIVKKGSCNKVVGVWTADDEINDFFMKMIGKRGRLDKRFVKIFLGVTDDELEKYCKINGVKFKKRSKDKAVQSFVDKISYKHPDSKHKIIKSLERLYRL